MPSLQRCEWNGIDGPPSDASTLRRKTQPRSAPSDCQPGAISSCKRSSGSFWTATLMSSSVIILTVFVLVEDVIPRYKTSMKLGQAQRGTWKAILPPVLTACHTAFCSKHSQNISMTAGFFNLYADCSKQDILKIGDGIVP